MSTKILGLCTARKHPGHKAVSVSVSNRRFNPARTKSYSIKSTLVEVLATVVSETLLVERTKADRNQVGLGIDCSQDLCLSFGCHIVNPAHAEGTRSQTPPT